MLKVFRKQSIEAACRKYNIQHGRSMLFCGPPGTGKTHLALCIAGEWNIPYLLVTPTEVLSPFVSKTAGNIKTVFEQASSLAEQAPHKIAFVVFDEIDAIGSARGDADNTTVIALVSEMDGLRSKRSRTKIIVIGTTNRPDSLDPALTRPGRLGVRVDFSPTKSVEEVAKSLSYFLKTHNFEIEHERLVGIAEQLVDKSPSFLKDFVEKAIEDIIFEREEGDESDVSLEEVLKAMGIGAEPRV